MNKSLSYYLNDIGLLIINLVLIGAFYYQFTLHELPCPLCLLQRVAIAAVAVGLAANLLRGEHPAHYGLMLLGSTSGIMVSVRQILLHIAPNDPGYGNPILGYHFYTWATVVFFLIFVGVGVMLLLGDRLNSFSAQKREAVQMSWIEYCNVGLALLLILANAVMVYFECGLHACPENPVLYLML